MTSIETFIQQLDAIPWFANLGRPSDRDQEVFRIHNWQTWPGPEDPGSAMQNSFHMRWHDNLFLKSTKTIPCLRKAWETIYKHVLRLAKPTVVWYDEQGDAWFGPNAAVWSAAYTASLVGCTILRDGGLDEVDLQERRLHTLSANVQWTLANEWSWYQVGHWPCMYYWPWRADIDVAHRTGCAKRLVIY
jgi:hypothetical protein